VGVCASFSTTRDAHRREHEICRCGCDVRFFDGRTKHLEALLGLIDRGFDTCSLVTSGLMMVRSRYHFATVRILLAAGADGLSLTEETETEMVRVK